MGQVVLVQQELEILKEAEADLDWYAANSKEIREKYDNQFIAIKGGSILASDKDRVMLVRRLRAMGVDPGMTLIKYITKMTIIL